MQPNGHHYRNFHAVRILNQVIRVVEFFMKVPLWAFILAEQGVMEEGQKDQNTTTINCHHKNTQGYITYRQCILVLGKN